MCRALWPDHRDGIAGHSKSMLNRNLPPIAPHRCWVLHHLIAGHRPTPTTVARPRR